MKKINEWKKNRLQCVFKDKEQIVLNAQSTTPRFILNDRLMV